MKATGIVRRIDDLGRVVGDSSKNFTKKSVSARDIEERQANSASATAPETSNTTQKDVHQPKTRSTNS